MVTMIAGDWVNPCGLRSSTMSRIAQTLPITPKMYRHFAAITVILTAALALFADDERQDMLKGELAKHQTASGNSSDDPRFAAARASNERAARKSKRATAGGEAGIDSGDGSFTPDADFSPPLPPQSGRAAMSQWALAEDPYGLNPEGDPTANMTPEMRRRMGTKKRKQAEAPPKLTQSQMNAMLERSAARSGVSGDNLSD